MKNRDGKDRGGERGIALITSLLVMTMLLALGVAIVFSTTANTTIVKSQRVGEQSFFVADAGIGIARRALAQAFSEQINLINAGTYPFYSLPDPPSDGTFPNIQVIPDPDAAPNDPFYTRLYSRANELIRITARDQELVDLNGSSFSVITRNPAGGTNNGFGPGVFSGSITLTKTDNNNAVQSVVFKYAFQVTGTTNAGGSAIVDEIGRISTNITLARSTSGGNRNFSFSGFGAFFDIGDDPVNHPNYLLSPGIYSGAVHTNTHFGFYTGWQYTFRNIVSQYESQMRIYPNSYVNLPTSDYQNSIHLSADGYKQSGKVPLPTNEFSQEYAVINGTGLVDKKTDGTPVDPPSKTTDSNGNALQIFDSNGRVTAAALAANLRTAANAQPAVSNNKIADGVYVSSSNGSTIDGAGIYVQNDASDIQLYSDSNGSQVYVIQQNSTTTTVTVDYTSNTTTISSSAGGSTTYSGVPIDKSSSKTDSSKWRAGASLYVNGNINSLRGGKDSSNNRPAISSKTALTITAARNIKVTGDIKYAQPVVNSDGTPVSNINTITNVLGLFTNDGNIFLDAKSAYCSSGVSVEINAANCVFDSDPSNNGQSPTGVEGGITSWIGSGHTTPGGGDRIKLVGSDVEKNNSAVDYSGGDTFFDVRFSGGTFRPPFFPGTTYSLGPAPTASVPVIIGVDSPYPTARSWFRENN